MQWYQCDIITEDGKIDYWTRFIAKDIMAARDHIRSVYRRVLSGADRDMKKAALFNIAALKVSKLSLTILNKYDLNSQSDVEKLHRRERG